MSTRDAIREFLQNEFILEILLKYDEVYCFTFTPDFPGPLSIVLRLSSRFQRPGTPLDAEKTLINAMPNTEGPAILAGRCPRGDISKDCAFEKPQTWPQTIVIKDPVVIDNSLIEYESDKEYVEYLRDLQACGHGKPFKRARY